MGRIIERIVCKPKKGYVICGNGYRSLEAHVAAIKKMKATKRERSKGYRSVVRGGYIRVRVDDPTMSSWADGRNSEHRLIAEKALGKPLPKRAVIHHVGSTADQENIVICQDAAYHRFLHQRTRAYYACGHADWFKCKYCHLYGPPELFSAYKGKKGWMKPNGHLVCRHTIRIVQFLLEKVERRLKKANRLLDRCKRNMVIFK